MISFAAIVPNPPLLLQNIGKENVEKLKETKAGLEDLEKKLDKADLDTLIIISSSKKMHLDAFGILSEKKYITDFKDFGDFETGAEFLPDPELIEKIRHVATDNEIPLTLIHNKKIDYNFGVPLHFLLKGKKIKVVPIVHCCMDIKTHYEMGKIMKRILTESNKKIGIIVSGNLSAKSTEKSPSGFSLGGKEFNEKFKELLESKSTSGLLSLDPKLVKVAEESVLSSTALLMGIIDKINYKTQIFSWEAPLGVGYTVTNFKLLK